MKPTPSPAEGPITKALHEAVALRKQLLVDGMAPSEADRIVGRGLKAVLSNPRTEPWRFYCETCRDTGWINVDPSPEEAERLTRMHGDASKSAGYAVKCEPCKWTQREREQRRQKQGLDGGEGEDDFVMAGKTKRNFSKFGK